MKKAVAIAVVLVVALAVLLFTMTEVSEVEESRSVVSIVKDSPGMVFKGNSFIHIHSNGLNLEEIELGDSLRKLVERSDLEDRLIAELDLKSVEAFTGELHLYKFSNNGLISESFYLTDGKLTRRIERAERE